MGTAPAVLDSDLRSMGPANTGCQVPPGHQREPVRPPAGLQDNLQHSLAADQDLVALGVVAVAVVGSPETVSTR